MRNKWFHKKINIDYDVMLGTIALYIDSIVTSNCTLASWKWVLRDDKGNFLVGFASKLRLCLAPEVEL